TTASRAITCCPRIRRARARTASTTSGAGSSPSPTTSEGALAAPVVDGREQRQDRRGRRMTGGRRLHRRSERRGERLAELHAPLIEGVYAPDDALREHAVLVEGDEASERRRIELLEDDQGARAAAGIDLLRNKRRELRRRHCAALEFRAHGLGRLPVQ